MASNSRIQLENWLKNIDVGADLVLDIGGAQNPVKNRTKSWNAKRYDILDLPNPHEWNAKPDLQADIQEIDFKSEYFKGLEYDKVFCLEVSEYWFNPLQALRNIAGFLKKGGALYISFHFVYPVHNPDNLDYLRYTRWGVEKLLIGAGFKIIKTLPRVSKRPDMLMDFYMKEGMKPNKNYRSHDEIGCLVIAQKV